MLRAIVVCKQIIVFVDALRFCLPSLFQSFLPGFSSVVVIWTAQNPWKAYQWRPVEETQQVSLTGSAASYSGVEQWSSGAIQWCSNCDTLCSHCAALFCTVHCICVVFKHGASLLMFANAIASFVSGSGYFIDLPANKSHASSMLSDLHVWRWVDKLTRALLARKRLASNQRREVRHSFFFTHTQTNVGSHFVALILRRSCPFSLTNVSFSV